MPKIFFGNLATNPLTILFSVILGVLTGIYLPSTASYLAPLGDSYLSLLVMCLLPIVFTVIALGFSRFLRDKDAYRRLGYLFLIVVISLLLLAICGVIFAILVRPNLQLHMHAEYMLGRLIKTVEHYPEIKKQTGDALSFATFLHDITPRNIVAALSEGVTLKLIVLSVLFGIALGKISGKHSDRLVDFFTDVNLVFNKIFCWLIYFLPLGIFCIFVKQTEYMDLDLLLALSKFIVLFYLFGIVILLIFNAIISIVMKRSYFAVFADFRHVLALAFFTDSIFIPIPSTLQTLRLCTAQPKMVDVTFPLGVCTVRFGRVLVFSLFMVFVAHFYAIPMTLHVFISITLISAFIAPLVPGRIVTIVPIFAMLATAINIPAAFGAMALVIIDPFVNRLESAITVYGNCALSLLVAGGKKR